MTYTTLIRWGATFLIVLTVSGMATCVAVNRHSDDASVAKVQAEATKATGEANKAMWDKMPAPPAASSH